MCDWSSDVCSSDLAYGASKPTYQQEFSQHRIICFIISPAKVCINGYVHNTEILGFGNSSYRTLYLITSKRLPTPGYLQFHKQWTDRYFQVFHLSFIYKIGTSAQVAFAGMFMPDYSEEGYSPWSSQAKAVLLQGTKSNRDNDTERESAGYNEVYGHRRTF